MRRSTLLLTALALFLSGCWSSEQLTGLVDRTAFQHIGGTLFTNPDLLTMKEVHLDNGSLTGREIIIEGAVAEVGKHHTYLVLSDSTARMLVVLTNIDAEPVLADQAPGQLRVLGTVESGKKGLPYVMARAINVAPPDEQPKA